MNIQRKVIPVEIEGEKYDLVLDFQAAITFQDLYGKSIFIGLQKAADEMDIRALIYLIAACLKDENNDPVGLEFVESLDLMTGMNYFMGKLHELVENSLDKEDSSKKKQRKQKKN